MAASKRTGGEGRRSEAEWREMVARCDASGLSGRAFCEREGLSLSSFQRWRVRCRRSSSAPFVELAATPAVEMEPPPSTEWSLELELPGGLRLHLRA